MAVTDNHGVRLRWRVDGTPAGVPLVLLNSIGTDMALWNASLPGLGGFRILRIDTRGHGGSDAPDGDYTLKVLAGDVGAVMDDAGFQRAVVAGVSLGGMIAMQLALDRPDRVGALILVCTSARMDRMAWADRVERVRAGGIAAIAESAMARFLSPAFREHHADAAAAIGAMLRTTPDAGYAGAAAAIRDMDLAGRLHEIRTPALVVAGDLDISTPYEGHGDQLVQSIPVAEAAHLPTGHLAPVEAPADLAQLVVAFGAGVMTMDAEAAAAQRLARLEAESAIRRVLARYMELCDTLSPETPMGELGALFTADARWEGRGRYAGAYGGHQGRDAIVTMLGAYRGPPPHFAMNAHFLSSESIAVDGDRAHGGWMMLQCSTYADGRSDLRAARLAIDFAVEDGRWRIASFATENLFSRPLDRWDDPAPIPVPER